VPRDERMVDEKAGLKAKKMVAKMAAWKDEQRAETLAATMWVLLTAVRMVAPTVESMVAARAVVLVWMMAVH